jgi:PAS domain S-box-containing protein
MINTSLNNDEKGIWGTCGFRAPEEKELANMSTRTGISDHLVLASVAIGILFGIFEALVHVLVGGSDSLVDELVRPSIHEIATRLIFLVIITISGILVQAMIEKRKKVEEALRQSEERYRNILDKMEEAYYEADLKGNLTFFNSTAVNRLGYTNEEMKNMNFLRLVDGDNARIAFQVYQEVLRTGEPSHGFECELMTAMGEKIPVEASVALVYNHRKKPVGFKGIVRDISARKKAEETLRAVEEQARLIAENAKAVIWMMDLELRYTYVSPYITYNLGYTPEEYMGKPLDEILTPASYDRCMEIFADEMRREKAGERDMARSRTVEVEQVHRDGRIIWSEVNMTLIRDASGRATGILGITQDISERKRVQEEMKKSEESYRAIFENTGNASIIFGEDTIILLANSRFVELSGYTKELVEGKMSWTSFIAPEDLERLRDYHVRRREGSGDIPDSYEFSAVTRGGERKEVFMSIALIPGTKISIASMMDVTERKRIDEALRKSEERYRTIFEKTATANIIIAEDTTILLANSNFARMAGYEKDEMEGKMSWTVFVDRKDLEMMKQYHLRRRSEGGTAPSSYEFSFISRTGETRNLFMSVALIPETKESVASMIDITEWKRSERARSESEERFRELAELLPETVYEADKYGTFTFVNKTGFEKFGYIEDDLTKGTSVFDMITPADHGRMIETYQKLVKGERVGLGEYCARRKDGTTFPALVHATAIFRDGKPSGHRGFMIDITEKKNLENQLSRAQKMEAIGTLAGGIAHDFNNLLMGILGNISLILMKFDKSHPIYGQLKSIEGYVQRGSDLTKQLLGFARGGKYEVRPTDLGEFMRESAELFGRTKKEIRIHHKAEKGLWTVEVDRGQIEQVLLNLYVNAWQAMPGGGDLFISAENVELSAVDVSPYELFPGRFVKVTVTDTGMGMDEATKTRIFEPFFTTKERGRGTGLGLASAYGIIKNHGGFIHAESEKDVGTSFMIYLPASDKEVDRDNKPADELIKGQETVLLVDDEEMILEVSAKMLETLGYRVITAAGGRKGLALYEQNKDTVDVVILDMIMPEVGGREAFEAMTRINPSVKVLLSSGYSIDSQAKEIMEKGCRGFIQKPFTMTDISKKLREILELR